MICERGHRVIESTGQHWTVITHRLGPGHIEAEYVRGTCEEVLRAEESFLEENGHELLPS